MKSQYTSTSISARIWFFTNLIFGFAITSISLFLYKEGWWFVAFFSVIVSSILSSPVLLLQSITLSLLKHLKSNYRLASLIIYCLILVMPYSLVGGSLGLFGNLIMQDKSSLVIDFIGCTSILFSCTLVAIIINIKVIKSYLGLTINYSSINQLITQTHITMETTFEPQTLSNQFATQATKASNNILWKAAITGFLILVMLIPTFFVASLVTEREDRQKAVVKEVTTKWSTQQTITSPYIYLPYTQIKKAGSGKDTVYSKYLLLLPENLSVNSTIIPEQRPRSIYKVLLYKSSTTANGTFNISLPKDIDINTIQFNDAKICVGVTDFKGIEERVTINFNGSNIELTPGLPVNDIDSVGLSAPVTITSASVASDLKFLVTLKIKGSERLYFTPLAGNSNFTIQSKWSNPSFDGNVLPTERTVSDNGFTAKWSFNKASLPFTTVLQKAAFDKANLAFGVAMVQPADQYAKTSRSVKYAILIIGLTFALFFIIELMQKKALHPVQYILVGLALSIFYTLLLSISEIILFDYAYLIAATATVVLIMLYAKGHFNNWATASIFGGILSTLYGFIFVLIRLEDTALLVGSIGLFVVLALVMYASRKINWYHPSLHKN
ncbi:MAG: cell envelope integrity protein CreD [Flavobacterium sp.]|nr:cell envelope integrity protein CreD [Flavobacterium sp.]